MFIEVGGNFLRLYIAFAGESKHRRDWQQKVPTEQKFCIP